jgi:hypothetical protein
MGNLTGTRHGDAANELLSFYVTKADELEQAEQYFMAAIALALALETGVLTYLLVEFGEENGGELEIPDSVNMSELIAAANEIDILNAPINIPSHVDNDEDETPVARIYCGVELIHDRNHFSRFLASASGCAGRALFHPLSRVSPSQAVSALRVNNPSRKG